MGSEKLVGRREKGLIVGGGYCEMGNGKQGGL